MLKFTEQGPWVYSLEYQPKHVCCIEKGHIIEAILGLFILLTDLNQETFFILSVI